ncbi:MAG: hypothetical protein QOE64_1601 [Frankiales bacterium]|jgi:hypothetical protein|nr:hypothetical protein [Frankiales bacterium]
MTGSGRLARLAATAVAGVLLLLGTLIGQDDDFPFGPFRMYATADKRGGEVVSTAIEVRTANSEFHAAPLTPSTTGLRRAELEGQLSRIVADPSLLRLLALAHARREPGAEAWTGVRVVQTRYQLRDGEPVGNRQVVLAQWMSE